MQAKVESLRSGDLGSSVSRHVPEHTPPSAIPAEAEFPHCGRTASEASWPSCLTHLLLLSPSLAVTLSFPFVLGRVFNECISFFIM